MRGRIFIVTGFVALACAPGAIDVPSSGDSTSGDSTSGESESSSETSSTTGESLFFPLPPDIPQPISCNPFEQDCPEGDKCVYTPFDYLCVPVLGGHAPGEPCTAAGPGEWTDDCDETSACANLVAVDGELVGICQVFCKGGADEPECPDGSSCHIKSDNSLVLCIDDCDPLAQDCLDGYGCYWGAGDGPFSCVVPTDSISAGQPCDHANDCPPGLECVYAESLPGCRDLACCTSWCDLSLGDGQCEALPGTSCESFFEPGAAVPGHEDLGLCISK